jgi:hypothetical protein
VALTAWRWVNECARADWDGPVPEDWDGKGRCPPGFGVWYSLYVNSDGEVEEAWEGVYDEDQVVEDYTRELREVYDPYLEEQRDEAREAVDRVVSAAGECAPDRHRPRSPGDVDVQAATVRRRDDGDWEECDADADAVLLTVVREREDGRLKEVFTGVILPEGCTGKLMSKRPRRHWHLNQRLHYWCRCDQVSFSRRGGRVWTKAEVERWVAEGKAAFVFDLPAADREDYGTLLVGDHLLFCGITGRQPQTVCRRCFSLLNQSGECNYCRPARPPRYRSIDDE